MTITISFFFKFEKPRTTRSYNRVWKYIVTQLSDVSRRSEGCVKTRLSQFLNYSWNWNLTLLQCTCSAKGSALEDVFFKNLWNSCFFTPSSRWTSWCGKYQHNKDHWGTWGIFFLNIQYALLLNKSVNGIPR